LVLRERSERDQQQTETWLRKL